MIDEYVEGRPMPRSPSALISEASVSGPAGWSSARRGQVVGGDVLTLRQVRQPAFLVVGPPPASSSTVSTYAFRSPRR